MHATTTKPEGHVHDCPIHLFVFLCVVKMYLPIQLSKHATLYVTQIGKKEMK